MTKVIGPFSQLITLKGLPLRGPIADSDLEVITDAGILVEDGTITQVGRWKSIRDQASEIDEISQPMVALPGFVDSHTHLCFGGSRQRDYALRVAGKTYLEIAAEGGGIWDTVQATRSCSQEVLMTDLITRSAKQAANGITTCEVKSGYGLSVDQELKMLMAIKQATQEADIDLVPTCLAAHTLPKDFAGDRQAYLQGALTELLPQVKRLDLAHRVDIFIEDGAFSPEEGKNYLLNARKLGFDITVHGDQFTTGGSQIAIETGASSVDHLEASGDKEIQALAKANIVSTALPGASLGLGCAFTPARKILDQGGILAIASDWNPGSAPMGDLLTQAAILGTYEKLSTAETLAGLTFRAASALKLADRGMLATGTIADLTGFPTADYRDILYYQGQMKPSKVWKKGLNVVSNE